MFSVMGLASWLAMGLLAGALATYLSRKSGDVGCLSTMLIGVAGALVGGFVATYLGFGGISGFDLRSLVVATLGAILLLLVSKLLFGRDR